jgi:HEAT repeat protein
LLLSLPATVLGQQNATWQGKTVGQWAQQLAQEDLRAQWYAAYALGQIGAQAAPAVDSLVEILRDRRRDEYLRGCAAWALGRIGSETRPFGGSFPCPTDGKVVELLTETLRSKHLSVRRNSPRALGRLGAAARPAVPTLLELLGDRDAEVRAAAAVAAWRIDRHPRAIRVLAEMTRRQQGPDAYQAVVALGQVASETQHLVPVWVAALQHVDPDVRRAAARELGQVGPAATAALREALSDDDQEVRRRAVEALGWMGPAAVPTLIEALRNESTAARRAAARALGRLGRGAKSAESALIEGLRDPDQQVRRAAARALGEIREE